LGRSTSLYLEEGKKKGLAFRKTTMMTRVEENISTSDIANPTVNILTQASPPGFFVRVLF
jgi:hypothetical protein